MIDCRERKGSKIRKLRKINQIEEDDKIVGGEKN
jgi:hypothetical protein